MDSSNATDPCQNAAPAVAYKCRNLKESSQLRYAPPCPGTAEANGEKQPACIDTSRSTRPMPTPAASTPATHRRHRPACRTHLYLLCSQRVPLAWQNAHPDCNVQMSPAHCSAHRCALTRPEDRRRPSPELLPCKWKAAALLTNSTLPPTSARGACTRLQITRAIASRVPFGTRRARAHGPERLTKPSHTSAVSPQINCSAPCSVRYDCMAVSSCIRHNRVGECELRTLLHVTNVMALARNTDLTRELPHPLAHTPTNAFATPLIRKALGLMSLFAAGVVRATNMSRLGPQIGPNAPDPMLAATPAHSS